MKEMTWLLLKMILLLFLRTLSKVHFTNSVSISKAEPDSHLHRREMVRVTGTFPRNWKCMWNRVRFYNFCIFFWISGQSVDF